MISCSFAVVGDQNTLNNGPSKIDDGQFKKNGATFNYQTWNYNDSFVKVDVVGTYPFCPKYYTTITIESGNGIVTVKNNPISSPIWVPKEYACNTTNVYDSNLTAEEFYWEYKNNNLK